MNVDFYTDTAVLTPEQYVKLTDLQRSNIARVQVEPPRMGTRDFGKLRIEFKHPMLARHERRR